MASQPSSVSTISQLGVIRKGDIAKGVADPIASVISEDVKEH